MIRAVRRRLPVARTTLLLAAVMLVGACSSSAVASPQPPGGSTGGSTGCPTAQPAALPAGETRTVTIESDKGAFAIKVEADLSPIAAGNVVALAACGFYDGLVFHRVATLQDGTPFVIQGGDPRLAGREALGYAIQDEPVSASYRRGTVAMARTGDPNSATSQFFIVLDDRDQEVLAAYNTYQIIGSVSSGMDAVDAIYKAAAGQELPANPIAMNKVTVSNP